MDLAHFEHIHAPQRCFFYSHQVTTLIQLKPLRGTALILQLIIFYSVYMYCNAGLLYFTCHVETFMPCKGLKTVFVNPVPSTAAILQLIIFYSV